MEMDNEKNHTGDKPGSRAPDGTDLDPRFERLIALLYGELPEDEAAALRREIESDPALRPVWEELSAARSALADWPVPETTPGFVFVKDPKESAPWTGSSEAPSRFAATRPARPRASWRERVRQSLGMGAWGMATAAALVLVLALTQFRVEQVPGGLAFRFGEKPALEQAENQAPAGPQSQEQSQEETQRATRMLAPAGSVSLEDPSAPPADFAIQARQPETRATQAASPVGAEKYLTEDEFQAYVAGMTRTMVALFNEYGEQRDREMLQVVQAALGEVTKRQTEDYQDLSGRIETVGIGLARGQYETNTRVDLLMQQDLPAGFVPATESPESDSEGER